MSCNLNWEENNDCLCLIDLRGLLNGLGPGGPRGCPAFCFFFFGSALYEFPSLFLCLLSSTDDEDPSSESASSLSEFDLPFLGQQHPIVFVAVDMLEFLTKLFVF